MAQKRESLRTQFLILRCQAGNDHAFADLYGMFAERTFQFLKGMMDVESAEDVQQEVWLTVYRKISTVSNPRGFRTWLYRTARHRAVDHLRRAGRLAERFESSGFESDEPAGTETIEEDLPIESNDIQSALKTLPPEQRDVLLLQFWEGMSYTEIALVVGCSIGTVRSRIHHAKRKMRLELASAAQADAQESVTTNKT